MKFKFSNIVWGVSLILAAAFIIFSQINDTMNMGEIGIGRIILAALLIVLFIQCIINRDFTIVPFPIAILYILLQAQLELPYIRSIFLLLAAVLAWAGLGFLFKKRKWRKRIKFETFSNAETSHHIDNNNNLSVSVNFGGISRRLTANNLETANFSCNFGALEVFFDQVTLSPNGAVIDLDCRFGGMELHIPKSWHVVEQINCSLGGVDVSKKFADASEGRPTLILQGNVFLGGIEIRHIKEESTTSP